ncbi:hypothetical protein ABMY26_08755 [Azospirillum sp. HJ39]
MVVADDGRCGASDRPGGYGLANMRRRALAIDARLAIVFGPGGSRIMLDLPRPAANHNATGQHVALEAGALGERIARCSGEKLPPLHGCQAAYGSR